MFAGTTDPRARRPDTRDGEGGGTVADDRQLEWLSPLRYTVGGQSPFAGEQRTLLPATAQETARGSGREERNVRCLSLVCTCARGFHGLPPLSVGPFQTLLTRGQRSSSYIGRHLARMVCELDSLACVMEPGPNAVRLAPISVPLPAPVQPSSASATVTTRSRSPSPSALPARLPAAAEERELLLQDGHRCVCG